MSIAALVVNFNTAGLTVRCVESLLRQQQLSRILVIDNGSEPEDVAALAAGMPPGAELLCNAENLGFAGACNQGIRVLLREPGVHAVLLFNSDAEAEPGLVAAMAAMLDADGRVSMVGAPMYRHGEPGALDSSGIAFYASCIASNRVDTGDPLFGPTGGCALYSRALLVELQAVHGYCFDEAFFCYAEDTDLAARALLLGHRPAIASGAAAHHHGQASSGGGFSRFVLYHGMRNSVWTMLKCVPWPVLLLRSPWILLAHAGVLLRHVRRGEARTVLRLYRDALRRVPQVLAQRRAVQSARRITAAQFAGFMSGKFYDRGYAWNAVKDLFASPRRHR